MPSTFANLMHLSSGDARGRLCLASHCLYQLNCLRTEKTEHLEKKENLPLIVLFLFLVYQENVKMVSLGSLSNSLKKCFSKTVLPNIRCKYLFCQILGQMLFISLLLGELLAASNNSALSHEEAGSPVPVQQLICVIKTPDCFHPFSFLACWFLVFVLLASWLQNGCHLPRHLIFTLGSQARRSKAKIISFQEALLFYSVLRPSTADFPLPLMV